MKGCGLGMVRGVISPVWQGYYMFLDRNQETQQGASLTSLPLSEREREREGGGGGGGEGEGEGEGERGGRGGDECHTHVWPCDGQLRRSPMILCSTTFCQQPT